MLVDVVPLRRNDEKIDREVLLRARPVRGYLRVVGGYATLTHTEPSNGGYHADVLPPLLDATVRITHKGALVIGRERRRPTESGVYDRQAWWVRFVSA